MHFSSILVTAVPTSFPECLQRLETLAGVEVHLRYPDRGRVVVTQETRTMEDQQEGFRRIQSLPEVLTAELVYQYQAAGILSSG